MTKSQAAKKRWKSISYRKKMSEIISKARKRNWRDPKWRQQALIRIRLGSKGSRRLKKVLGRGWKTEHLVNLSNRGAYRIDVAFPRLKLAIEVDGDSHRYQSQKIRDRRRERNLVKLGWAVFRVSEKGCRLL